MDSLTSKDICYEIRNKIHPTATVMTDGFKGTSKNSLFFKLFFDTIFSIFYSIVIEVYLLHFSGFLCYFFIFSLLGIGIPMLSVSYEKDCRLNSLTL